MSHIATAIKDLQTCQRTLDLREQFIQENMMKFQPQAEPAFWQEPSFIISGMVVSFGVGALLMLAIKNSQP